MAQASDIRDGSAAAVLAGTLGIGFLATGGVALFLDASELWFSLTVVLMVASAVLGLVSRAGPVRRGWSVVLDPDGVSAEQVFGPMRHAGHVLWSELVEVGIVTSTSDQAAEGFYWVLLGEGAMGCVVPLGLSQELGIFAALSKLPGFDFDAVAHACTAGTDASFQCWRGRPGQGGVASEGLRRRPHSCESWEEVPVLELARNLTRDRGLWSTVA